MTINRTLLTVLAIACFAISGFAGEDSKLTLTSSSRETTKSMKIAGIDVILRHTTANEVVSAIMFIRGGTCVLPAGTSSAIEGMALKVASESGSSASSKEEYQRKLSGMVSTISGDGGRDYSKLSMRCVREHFADTWGLFSGVIAKPAFDSVEIMKDKRSTITGIKSIRSNPDAYVQYLGDSVYFQGHPYSQRPTVDEVNAITPDNLQAHFKSLFVKARLLLVVVGNVTEADLKQLIESSLAKLPDGTFKAPKLANVSRAASAVIADKKLPTTYILGGYAAPNRRQPDYWAMVMANTTLSDRLFTEVRVKRNLSYAPSAFLRPDEITVGGVYVSTTQPDSAMRVIFRCIDSLQNVPMTDKEVKSQVAQFLTTVLMRDETNAGQAEALGRYQLMTGNWENSMHVVENFQKLTPKDIQTVAKKYMHNFTFAAVGKAENISKALLESR